MSKRIQNVLISHLSPPRVVFNSPLLLVNPRFIVGSAIYSTFELYMYSMTLVVGEVHIRGRNHWLRHLC